MKAYMGYDRHNGPLEGAVLIFAHSYREAKRVGARVVQDLFDSEFIDVRVNRLWTADHLFVEADQDKLARGTAHVIDNPKTCVRCETWGYPFDEDGVCKLCRENRY